MPYASLIGYFLGHQPFQNIKPSKQNELASTVIQEVVVKLDIPKGPLIRIGNVLDAIVNLVNFIDNCV